MDSMWVQQDCGSPRMDEQCCEKPWHSGSTPPTVPIHGRDGQECAAGGSRVVVAATRIVMGLDACVTFGEGLTTGRNLLTEDRQPLDVIVATAA